MRSTNLLNKGHAANVKSRSAPQWRTQKIAHKKQRIEESKSQRYNNHDNADLPLALDGQDPDGIETRRSKGSQAPRTFSQPSVMSPGDKGIILTTDMGREKKGLIELSGLVEEYLEQHDLLQPIVLSHGTGALSAEQSTLSDKTSMPGDCGMVDIGDDSDMDIEASIERELSGLTSNKYHAGSNNSPNTSSAPGTKQPPKPFQLITLDIPCVSFLRFHTGHPAYSLLDPVVVTHSICHDAMKTGIMRSRYIRRLSPVSWLGKTLAGGLERGSDIVLPPHFDVNNNKTNANTNIVTVTDTQVNDDNNNHQQHMALSDNNGNNTQSTGEGLTFAIRPAIRNNDRVSRDDVIQVIADRVTELGQGRHKVDLKGYQKGILVEVYRGWIGISVVDNQQTTSSSSTSRECGTNAESGGSDGSGGAEMAEMGSMESRQPQFEYGYEQLKRFNLAEIYAEVLKRKM